MHRTCHHCLKALQLVVYREYEAKCHGCTFRALAYQTAEQRERFYQRAQHLSGPEAARELKRNVDLERARIQALSAACPRKERA